MRRCKRMKSNSVGDGVTTSSSRIWYLVSMRKWGVCIESVGR